MKCESEDVKFILIRSGVKRVHFLADFLTVRRAIFCMLILVEN